MIPSSDFFSLVVLLLPEPYFVFTLCHFTAFDVLDLLQNRQVFSLSLFLSCFSTPPCLPIVPAFFSHQVLVLGGRCACAFFLPHPNLLSFLFGDYTPFSVLFIINSLPWWCLFPMLLVLVSPCIDWRILLEPFFFLPPFQEGPRFCTPWSHIPIFPPPIPIIFFLYAGGGTGYPNSWVCSS